MVEEWKGLEDELPLEANGDYTKSRRRSLINGTIHTLAAHLFGNMLQEDDRIIKQAGRPGAKRLFVLAKFLPGEYLTITFWPEESQYSVEWLWQIQPSKEKLNGS
ncbi:hypothetical protein Prudu_012590 [Prunus dulcis]|uniref:Uncharacterized protein n=1 Tax=Prunus dulcis TaxID=3755 RepID=A0A4Y1RD06_PRUDU|nr:hypothetical protein Prudu_012590 [Prunus dulcis]